MPSSLTPRVARGTSGDSRAEGGAGGTGTWTRGEWSFCWISAAAFSIAAAEAATVTTATRATAAEVAATTTATPTAVAAATTTTPS